ncbi:hypothetical protein JYU34_011949 [Plutella xylostella]|uniref:Uncharacterized protein n=1 Tax=Plutella xylostella TaxID=51655 RepID=A0ABQ7QDY7_PLUXY|nr:hypothetical protein JYU34_011949 [Plutella xylostella]
MVFVDLLEFLLNLFCISVEVKEVYDLCIIRLKHDVVELYVGSRRVRIGGVDESYNSLRAQICQNSGPLEHKVSHSL